MTDKEKLVNILRTTDATTFEDIITTYLYYYPMDFSIIRLKALIDKLNNEYLNDKIKKLDQARFIAKERAGYLKRYLDGSMWKDKETAKYNLEPQIENAQAIIDACSGG